MRLRITTDLQPKERHCFPGVHGELHAIAVQDRVFLQGQHVDPHYQAPPAGVFIVAVNGGPAGGTCFCASMQYVTCRMGHLTRSNRTRLPRKPAA